MAKVNLNKLSVFCSNQSTIFRTLSSIIRTRPEVFHPKVFMCKEHRWLKLINRLKFLVLKFGIVYPDI